MTARSDRIPRYTAMALQLKCHAINLAKDSTESRKLIRNSINRIDQQIRSSKAFVGADTKLVVLPEYFLTGYPMGESFSQWIDKACLEIDGSEYEELGKVAQSNDVFLAGNAYEIDPNFEDIYFQTCFVIDPSGDVVLRYRRLNSMFAATPHDVWDKYLECYGLEGVFPVARTAIGSLAGIASEEILYPEIARCLMMRGAEVLIHSTSQTNELARAPKDSAIDCRAIENMAYVVSSNSGGIIGTPLPEESADGGSKIVDYKGITLAKSGPGETMTAYAGIDLEALRYYRRRPGMENLISRQRFELFAESYRQFAFYPVNTFLTGERNKQQLMRNQLKAIEELSRNGVI